ncbi:MAG: ATPase [Clostridiaceae bacterium]|nr:ATPase [Clostridiaceae bacterium]
MPRGKGRDMFLGANTCRGFFSFYSYIISPQEAKRVFILKGGPGVGKSTFMKRAAERMLDLGYEVENMHCSSDSKSLDGIVIPQIGIAMIDGTAPHMIDPKYPGAVDEIINLGEFWDHSILHKKKQIILEIRKQISQCYARAYRHLAAAACIFDDNAALYESGLDEARVNIATAQWIDEMFDLQKPATKVGSQRCLFASAITPEGLKNYLDGLMTQENIYMVKGSPWAGTQEVLECVKTNALIRGYNVEAYYCAFNPSKLEHIVVPQLNMALTTVNEYHTTDVCTLKEIDFAQMLDPEITANNEGEIEDNRSMFEDILNKAIELMRHAKVLHDELEAYYIPAMDFTAVQDKWDMIMERILDI